MLRYYMEKKWVPNYFIAAMAGESPPVHHSRIFISCRGSAAVAAAIPAPTPRRIRLERGPLDLQGE